MSSHVETTTRKDKTCIDHTISNISSALGWVEDLGLSDHDTGQFINFPLQTKIIKQEWFEKKGILINLTREMHFSFTFL